MKLFRFSRPLFSRNSRLVTQNSSLSSQAPKIFPFLECLGSKHVHSFSTVHGRPVWRWENHPILVREFTSTAQDLKPAPSERVSAIVDEISGLTLLEVADLTEILRQKLDVQEMPIMAVMMPGMGFGVKGAGKAGGAAKVEEKAAEKTAFDLKLEGFDAAAKIKIIKEVRTFTDLGLKEAKDLVEKAPTLLKKGVPKEEAVKIIEKMKEVGAKVTME